MLVWSFNEKNYSGKNLILLHVYHITWTIKLFIYRVLHWARKFKVLILNMFFNQIVLIYC